MFDPVSIALTFPSSSKGVPNAKRDALEVPCKNRYSGLQSRPGNCQYTLVVGKSGLPIIVELKFFNNKGIGPNASEIRHAEFREGNSGELQTP